MTITAKGNEKRARHIDRLTAMQDAHSAMEKMMAALKPFAELADRKEYNLNDVPHDLMINAKLALRLKK